MMLCHEVPRMAVRNLTLTILSLRFKLPVHLVDEGTMFIVCQTFAVGKLESDLIRNINKSTATNH